MNRFAALYNALDDTTKTNEKVAALAAYFTEAPAADAAWAVYFLTGGRPKRLLTGSKPTGPTDFRAHIPRFAGDAGKKNAAVVERFQAFATKTGRTPAQLAVGWVLAKQPRLTPLVGARTTKQLADILAVLDKPLSPQEVADVEAIVPTGAIEGTRYAAAQMAHLDSEK